MQRNKYKLLRNGLIMDAIGVATMYAIDAEGYLNGLYSLPFESDFLTFH